MNKEDYQAILDRFTYKPGWGFHVEDHDRFVFVKVLVINFVGPCSYRENQVSTFQIKPKFFLPLINTEKLFIAFLMRHIANFEMHELREWAKLDGKPVSPPQHEVFPGESIDDYQVH